MNKKNRISPPAPGAGLTRSPAGCRNSDRISPATLEAFLPVVVSALGASRLRPLAGETGGVLSRTRALLEFLTLCYARQVYSSEQVSQAARRLAGPPGLAGETCPDAGAIRRFRDANRAAIFECLLAALHFLMAETDASEFAGGNGKARLAEEASRRIMLAMFFDGMELAGEPAAGGHSGPCEFKV